MSNCSAADRYLKLLYPLLRDNMYETTELKSQMAILNEKYPVPDQECLKLFDENDIQTKHTQGGTVYFNPKEMNIVANILITYWNEEKHIKPLSSESLRIMGKDEEKAVNRYKDSLMFIANQIYESNKSNPSKLKDFILKARDDEVNKYYLELLDGDFSKMDITPTETGINRPVISYAINNNHWSHIRDTFEAFEEFEYIDIINKDTLPLYIPTEKLMEAINAKIR